MQMTTIFEHARSGSVYVSAHHGYRDMEIISQTRGLFQLCLNKKRQELLLQARFFFSPLLVDSFASVV